MLTVAFAFWPFKFYYYSLCSKCGEIQNTTDWQLPLTFSTFWSHASIEPTALSRYLASSRLVPAHKHDWQFGHGGGNGVRCALGAADRVRPLLTSTNVTTFLDLARQYGEPGESAKFLEYTIDPELCRAVFFLAGSIPHDIHSSQEFRRWMEEYRFFVDDEIEEANKHR